MEAPQSLPGFEPLWTVKEVADYARVDLRTVYRIVREGSMPSVRVRGSIRIPDRGLREYLNDQATDTD